MTSPRPHSLRHRARREVWRKSSALIITLAIVAALTILLLAFLTRAGMERQIAGASAAESKADQIAKAGLDVVVTDFRQEIAAGSTVTANTTNNPGWPAIYLPVSAKVGLPARILSGTSPTSETNNFNLVRCSMTVTAFASVTNVAPLSSYYSQYGGAFPTNNLASSPNANTTANPSANGRSISAARWNKPQLLNDTTHFVSPDWVLVTRNGPKAFTAWNATVADASPANTNYIVGRYAYTVYDEGGLLDANVVGRLSTIPTPPIGKTTVAAMADMTQLTNSASNWTGSACVPAQSTVDKLVQWRNASTAASAYNSANPSAPTTYFGYVTGTTNSLAQVQPGNQAFLTRQDLINSITSTASGSLGAAGFTTNALPFLATFTRQVNAPSFYPALQNFKTTPVPTAATTDRPVVGASGVTADQAPYRSSTLGQDTTFNPPLADVRFPVSTVLNLPNGATVQVTAGQPLLRQRFALSRLALLTAAMASTTFTNSKTETDPVYHYFGLYRTSATSPWVYDHGEPNGGIYTLPELQSAFASGTTERDPDFFELLQAAIALGSLGRDAGAPYASLGEENAQCPTGPLYPVNTSSTSLVGVTDQSVTEHVLQIGANIIDEASAYFYPITIQDANTTFQVYGTEDLPYISKIIHFVCYDGLSPTSGNAQWGGWYCFEIWNPYQPNTNSGSAYPTNFRITGTSPLGHPSTAFLSIKGSNHQIYSTPIDFNANPSYLNFSVANPQTFFTNPVILDPSNGSITFTKDPNNPKNFGTTVTESDGAHAVAGLFVGDVSDGTNLPNQGSTQDYEIHPGTNSGSGSNQATVNPGGVNIALQVQTPNGWQTYNLWRDLYQSKNGFAAVPTTYFFPGPKSIFYYKTDPRTDRWSCGVDTDSAPGNGYASKLGITLFANPGTNNNGYKPTNWGVWWLLTSSGFNSTSAAPFWSFNMNIGAGATFANGLRYMDPDGVTRGGDDLYSDKFDGAAPKDSNAYYGFSQNLTASNGTSNGTGPYLSRPIMLHRPFQSVGELGYAFRDVAWKSLDFFTSRSADSALLDVFSAYEEPSIVAGKVDLNTRNVPVLAALLNGACIDELGSGNASSTQTSPAEALSFANKLVGVSSSSPFHNKSDLVNRLLASQNDAIASPVNNDTWGNSFVVNGSLLQAQQARIKTNRESALRSLSEASASRTWNLMIDIVAQSGRYTSSSSSFADFTTDGEKRYWLHVAIDRYTGKVIDEQLEPVYE